MPSSGVWRQQQCTHIHKHIFLNKKESKNILNLYNSNDLIVLCCLVLGSPLSTAGNNLESSWDYREMSGRKSSLLHFLRQNKGKLTKTFRHLMGFGCVSFSLPTVPPHSQVSNPKQGKCRGDMDFINNCRAGSYRRWLHFQAGKSRVQPGVVVHAFNPST